MKRDGINESLWQTLPDYQPQAVSVDTQYDVAIVGGGMTGVITAYLLQKAGKRCILLEAHNLGFGTTGGTTAHLNTLLDTPYTTITKNFNEDASRTVARATAEAIDLIKTHVHQFSIDCGFETASAFLFAQNDDEVKELNQIYKASNAAGLEITYNKSLPIAAPYVNAIEVKRQAKFHPTKYLFAMAQAFEEVGGHIVIHSQVNGVKPVNDLLEIQTDGGKTIKAEKIFYATHIPPGVNLLHMRCAPWRSYAMAVRLADDHYPENLIYDMKDPYHYYRTQLVDGAPYLIVGGEDHKTGDIENTELCFQKLRLHIEELFSVSEITHRWSSQYFESADGLPYIGILPGHDDHYYVATGYGGNGMTYSHVAAMEIASLIVENKSLYEGLFKPSRIKPIAGFANFIDHNAHVAKKFATKHFDASELEVLADITRGQGKVVEYHGEKIALSKDFNGKLHAVSPVCTHMKCSVAWNGSEQTWDCPCHGARYAPDGEVVTGPADRALEKIELQTLVEKK